MNEPFLLKVVAGITYRMKAYETLYTEGVPVGWGEGPTQINYYIVHQLRVKDLAKMP